MMQIPCMVSQVFAFVETKKTAELIVQGLSRDEIKTKVQEENLYQLKIEQKTGFIWQLLPVIKQKIIIVANTGMKKHIKMLLMILKEIELITI